MTFYSTDRCSNQTELTPLNMTIRNFCFHQLKVCLVAVSESMLVIIQKIYLFVKSFEVLG